MMVWIELQPRAAVVFLGKYKPWFTLWLQDPPVPPAGYEKIITLRGSSGACSATPLTQIRLRFFHRAHGLIDFFALLQHVVPVVLRDRQLQSRQHNRAGGQCQG